MIIIQPGTVVNFTIGQKGTYVLFIRLIKEIPIVIQKKKLILKPGFYIYVGSAFGAGGLSSRLHRHIRKIKQKHWHIDQVTMSDYAFVEGIGISLNKKIECEIATKLSKINFLDPITNFGNSDCGICQSHFFYIQGDE